MSFAMWTTRAFILTIFISVFFSGFSQDLDVGSLAVLVQHKNGSGSGFYLADESTNSIYFVTAAHVLVDSRNNFYSNSIYLISYQKDSQKDRRDSFLIMLEHAYKRGLFAYDLKKDVAVLKIASTKNQGVAYLSHVKKLTHSNTFLNPFYIHMAKKIREVKTMKDIYTIGYPKSLSLSENFDFNRPLIRKGIIAGLDLEKGKIVGDLPVYHGNSGGAVFQPDGAFLIGLVSQFVPFEEHWKSSAYGYANVNIYNSGYAIIVPVDNILDEIDRLREE